MERGYRRVIPLATPLIDLHDERHPCDSLRERYPVVSVASVDGIEYLMQTNRFE